MKAKVLQQKALRDMQLQEAKEKKQLNQEKQRQSEIELANKL